MAIELGTVSHGTLRPRDLLDAFLPIIEEEDESSYDDLMAHSGDAGTAYRLGWDDQESDALLSEWLNDSVFPVMEDLAPPGAYFGSTEGDGTDFGFWIHNPAEDENAYELARRAGCTEPDTLTSAGAVWLGSVADSYPELVETYNLTGDLHDAIHALADEHVPIYTSEVLDVAHDLRAHTFADEAKYDGLIAESATIEQRLQTALYVIAERLLSDITEDGGLE